MAQFDDTIARVPFAAVVPSEYGPMIVHRLDDAQGAHLFRHGRALGHDEIVLLAQVLARSPENGRVVVDVGANFGAFALALSRLVGGNGKVHAFEPQRVIYYMLAGTMALNAAVNVHCHMAAVGAGMGRVEIPQFDYFSPLSFGSVEFGPVQKEKLAQERRHDPDRREFVPQISLDSMGLDRLDLLKIDAEGMELDVLRGAEDTIRRCRPVIYAEWLKVGETELRTALEALGYRVESMPNANLLAWPNAVPAHPQVPP